MSTRIERCDESARRPVGAFGRTTVGDDELLRHPVYTRVLHWSVAIFFILALLSGFAIYSPWLFRALTPLLGGGPMTRLLHPWFSLGFELFFLLQLLNWLGSMRWTPADTRWMGRMRDYVANTDRLEPEDVGFFNAGQKLYFWAILASAIVFLISGIPMWFPDTFGRGFVALGLILHDLAALIMLVGLIVHLYETLAQQPGTFQAMTRGSVSRRWAWTHHPGWYRQVTHRDPRDDYEQARRRQQERAGGELREG